MMSAAQKTALFVALTASLSAQTAHLSTVKKVAVTGDSPFQLRIETTRPVVPQVQMVANPDRLVVDIPNSLPASNLHGLKIQRADVRAVRISQYSTQPPVTRVVVDLNAPEWYRVTPSDSGIIVSLGHSDQSAANAAPAIGWVSAQVSTTRTGPMVLRKTAAAGGSVPNSATANGASVQFANGLLTIHANNATLSEVLFQIQKITGAEIAIPSGTEQERVASDFGPGTPSEVMGELLNGSGLDFVVVGSPSDPNQLRSVILSRNTGAPDPPSAFRTAQSQASVPPIEPDNPDISGPVDNAQQQNIPPDSSQQNVPPPGVPSN